MVNTVQTTSGSYTEDTHRQMQRLTTNGQVRSVAQIAWKSMPAAVDLAMLLDTREASAAASLITARFSELS